MKRSWEELLSLRPSARAKKGGKSAMVLRKSCAQKVIWLILQEYYVELTLIQVMSGSCERDFLNPMKTRQGSDPLRISLQRRQALLDLSLHCLLVKEQLVS